MFSIAPASPGIFSVQFGLGNAIAINPDGSLAGPAPMIGGLRSQPAAPGGVLVILATGLGEVDMPLANGQNSSDKIRNTILTPTVLVGGRRATVLFSGLSPQFVGVNQVNVMLPENVDFSPAAPLQIEIASVLSVENVTIATRTPNMGERQAPTIDTPAPLKRLPLSLRPSALPAGSHPSFPAYDGDPFSVTFPVTVTDNVTTQDVLNKYILPVIFAMGFDHGQNSLALPPANGINLARANFDGLAKTVADEYKKNPQLLRPNTQQMINAFLSREGSTAVDQALLTGEGMTLSQFIAGIERLEIQYPFLQVDNGVPIEHSLVYATRWEQQGITTIRGSLVNRYVIANENRDLVQYAISCAILALLEIPGVSQILGKTPPEDGPYLVLLPYGTDAAGIIQLRYAYRMVFDTITYGHEGRFILWLDAETQKILKLDPLFDVASSSGVTYNRDPGVGTTTTDFQVDPSSGGQYTLKLAGMANRVDYQGNGYDALDVSISDAANGSSATFANFNQAPINDPVQALCGTGTNKAFQQVNFFGVLSTYYQNALSLSIYTPFPKIGGVAADPPTPWNPKVESASAGCNAWSSMDYGACSGYFDMSCPNQVGTFMNFAHDNTVVGHELAHSITPRFTQARPSNWCGMGVCSIPLGWGVFHDLADFWADHFESTNCTAGWVAKNLGGAVNASLNCAMSDEDGGLPRLHTVTVPFNPAAAGDHFPEHRALGNFGGGYADGQIGAAALWQLRIGMRSKCRPSGLPQFGVRFARALKQTGFFGAAPPLSDTAVYRYLYDLEHALVDQWATSGSPMGPPAFAHNGPHTTNKVTAGFARAGIFLVPYQCMDGDPMNNDPMFCPTENTGDAVIDIDDNDVSNDFFVNGVSHPTFDFLKLGGVAPTFLVWTGPRFKLDGTMGASTLNNPAICNTKFNVDVAPDPAFPGGSTISSGFINVLTDPTAGGTVQCYGTWTPTAAQWTALQAGGVGTRIYYRATTRNAADANQRVSTQPGNGLWTVPPPYAVITADGKSDY
jgi:hypothetical protein